MSTSTQNQATYMFEREEVFEDKMVTLIFYSVPKRNNTNAYKVFTQGERKPPKEWVETQARRTLLHMGLR